MGMRANLQGLVASPNADIRVPASRLAKLSIVPKADRKRITYMEEPRALIIPSYGGKQVI